MAKRAKSAKGEIDAFLKDDVAGAYERLVRPSAYRWPDWIARCRTQAEGGLAALNAQPWAADERLSQDRITAALMLASCRSHRNTR